MKIMFSRRRGLQSQPPSDVAPPARFRRCPHCTIARFTCVYIYIYIYINRERER